VACIAAATSATDSSAVPDDAKPALRSGPASVPDNAVLLSRIVYPQEMVVQLESRAFAATLAFNLKSDPKGAAEFGRYPGLLDAIISAGRVVLQKHVVARAPEAQRQIAQFYAQRFTPAEIDQLISFYSSPTGLKLVAGMYTGTNVKQLTDEFGAGLEKGLTEAQESDLKRRAAIQGQAAFTPEDRKALIAFAATPLHAKLGRVRPEFHALIQSIFVDPTLDAELSEAVQPAVNDYMAKHDTKGSR